MSHRIFIALPIAQALQDTVMVWEQKFHHVPVRWLQGKNLHITLIPPWETEQIDDMVAQLHSLKNKIGPIALHFTKVRFGPNLKEPRLIWAEGNASPQLLKLKSALEIALGFDPSLRPLKLHMTLARFRPENFHSFPMKTLDESVNWRDTANSFVLMESHLLPTGADYEITTEVPLSQWVNF